jgi:hypothetical protein
VEPSFLSRFMNDQVGISLSTFEKLSAELGLQIVAASSKGAVFHKFARGREHGTRPRRPRQIKRVSLSRTLDVCLNTLPFAREVQEGPDLANCEGRDGLTKRRVVNIFTAVL